MTFGKYGLCISQLLSNAFEMRFFLLKFALKFSHIFRLIEYYSSSVFLCHKITTIRFAF